MRNNLNIFQPKAVLWRFSDNKNFILPLIILEIYSTFAFRKPKSARNVKARNEINISQFFSTTIKIHLCSLLLFQLQHSDEPCSFCFRTRASEEVINFWAQMKFERKEFWKTFPFRVSFSCLCLQALLFY